MIRRITLCLVVAVAAGALALAHDEHENPFEDLPRDVKGTPRAPTYHRHVAKILRKNCTTCHTDGDIAPMALDDYTSAKDWIDVALEEIGKNAMPPWQPTRGVGRFHDERGLSDKEISTLVRWSEQGAVEGRPPRRTRPQRDNTGWALGEPDVVLDYGETFEVPGEGDDIYRCFPIRTDFGEDVYVRTVDMQPGDRRVVHHVVLYLDETNESHDLDADEPGPGYVCFGGPGTSNLTDLLDGDAPLPGAVPASPVLGGWAPGNRPITFPKQHGIRIPAGATVVMQVHYHPLPGEPVSDRSKFGLYFAKGKSPGEVFLLPVVNMNFTIPAGDPAYVVTAELDPRALLQRLTGVDLPVSGRILSVMPHMHNLGREILVDVNLPDGTSQRLVEIDNWSFDWQDTYLFKKPVKAPYDATLHMRCVYDNSAENPLNPNSPPQPVSWGERTVDEMALAFVALTFQFPDNALDLFELIGRDLPHARGLRPIKASKPPFVRGVRLVEGRLEVTCARLAKGGRIEVNGRPLEDSMLRRTARRLTSPADWDNALPLGEQVEIQIRRADGRTSLPFFFTR